MTTEQPLADDDYQYRRPSLLTRLLGWCAGADMQLLAKSPHSDHVKYQGIGGVVLATGLLAFLSGTYAFYVVFGPHIDKAAHEQPNDPASWAIAVGFGVLWGGIIFNLDRFVVSSTGKGDGTENITFKELVMSLPRLGMAGMIGLCLSQPIETRIFKTEIDAALQREQDLQANKCNGTSKADREKIDQDFNGKRDALKHRRETRENDMNAEAKKRHDEIETQEKLLEAEEEGKTGTGKSGRGHAFKSKQEHFVRIKENLATWNGQNDKELKGYTGDYEQLDADRKKQTARSDAMLKDCMKEVIAEDGLMKRIDLVHEKFPTASHLLTLLLIIIECAPIFFKMMLAKGAYDYLDDRQKALVRAQNGIEVFHVLLPKGSQHIGGEIAAQPPGAPPADAKQWEWTVAERHFGAERILAAGRKDLESQEKLLNVTHGEFVAAKTAEIKANPAKFIDSDGTDVVG